MSNKIKLLIITHCIPYPLDSGGNVSQFAMLEGLQKVMNVTLCLVANNDKDNLNIGQLQQLLPEVNIKVIILYQKNVPTNRFTIKNVKSIAKRFIQRFSSYKPLLYDEFLDGYRINPLQLKKENFINQLSEIFCNNKYDIAQVEFHECLELIHVIPKSLKTTYVLHESRLLRLESASLITNTSKKFSQYIIDINKAVELSLINRYDTVITFSEKDQERLKDLNVRNVVTIPFPILDCEFDNKNVFKAANQLVFIGGESHMPNKEGIDWFLKECFDQIYKEFELPLVIIGKWYNTKGYIDQFGEKIRFVGYIEDLNIILKESIMIVPIRIGNGIRAKILYGMAKKIPIISTGIGYEGIDIFDKTHLLKADDVESFISCLRFILSNNSEVNKILESACSFVTHTYSQKVLTEQRVSIYSRLLNTQLYS
ncbi:MAG: glycosyltransferase [Bacteroidota bacterium]